MLSYGYLYYLPVTIIFLFFIFLIGILKKRPFGYYLVSCIICVYLNLLVKYAFFPIWLDGSQFFTSVMECVNFKLDLMRWDTYQIVGNLLLTYPIGFCIPFILNISKRKNYLLTLLLSVSIECIQLIIIITLHTVDITFDIQDVILNAIGGLIGCVCFSIISKLVTILFKRFFSVKLKGHDLFSLILIICTNYTNGQGTFSTVYNQTH